MKKSTKALLLGLCAIALVAASVMGTLAYLTSTDSVTNTFTVGKVAITLDEAKVDVNGTILSGDQAGRGDANSYKLVPGHEYTKDPIVHVDANSEPCYVFVKVVNGITSVEATTETNVYTTIAEQMTANGWSALDATNNPGVYYYNKNNTAIYTPATGDGADNDLEVFAKFKVADTATNDTLSTLMGESNDKTIEITAYAIQSDGFESAAAAWAASGFGTTTTN